MKNFRINPPGYKEPAHEPHWYNIGTFVAFVKDLSEPSVINISFA